MSSTLSPPMITNGKHCRHCNFPLHILVVTFSPNNFYLFSPGIRSMLGSGKGLVAAQSNEVFLRKTDHLCVPDYYTATLPLMPILERQGGNVL